jgi:hypothetical protein
MKKASIAFLAAAALLVATSAWAQLVIGGNDESTEDHTGAQWAAAAAATPGTSGVVAGSHLLITEVGMRGLNSATLADSTEFVEIYNPTGAAIDLSNYYLSDVNSYYTVPVTGQIDIAASTTDFAFRFPFGATIAPGQAQVVAIDGPRYKRGTGVDANYQMVVSANSVTTATPMIDVMTNKPAGWPAFGFFTNGGEFTWLFYWDQVSDLPCDIDLVYWGTSTGANLVARKTNAICQDGPDAGAGTTCFNNDAGNTAGTMTKPLSVPANGTGTRQRVTAEGAEGANGNGCIPGGATATHRSTWGGVKSIYR